MTGSSCSKIYNPPLKTRKRWIWLLIAVLLLAAVIEIGRRLILAHSIYRLNLRTQAPLKQMPPLKQGQKIVILAPHPDDETLGCGGLIQQAIQAGAHVKVVVATNGEYPEIDVIIFEKTIKLTPQKFIRLGYMRQRETLTALSFLGLPPENIIFLGYPNGNTYRMWLPGNWLPSSPVRSPRTKQTRSPYVNSFTPKAIYCGQSILEDIEAILMREKPDVVIAPHPNDIHSGHWSVYAFTRYALDELASQGHLFAQKCVVYTYLIHRSFWPAPRGFRPWVMLEPPAPLVALNQTEWFALPLTVAQMIDKRKAIGMYRTQFGAIDRLLQSFARGNELFGVVKLTTWPIHQKVPAALVIKDPVGDLFTNGLKSRGDIAGVWLLRNNDRFSVKIRTRRPPTSKINFHFSINSGGLESRDRVIAYYSWQKGQASALVLKDGRLRRYGSRSVAVDVVGSTVIFHADWPLSDTRQTFLIIRAWTTSGGRIIDGTAVTRLWIGKLPPGY
ncbi:MAG: PIG-L family deacetylase [Armatimonadetes bacterium]|nr:PIG-L family deacetylase [Armatimonadota bacterium]